MATFWAALAAYIVGWLLCNLFIFKLADRFRDVEAMQSRVAKKMAQEYYKLAHPEAVPMPDTVEKELAGYENV